MATDPLFRMIVEDVFSIRGRGTVVTGRIGQGSLEAEDVVELRGRGYTRQVVVAAIEIFRRRVKQAGAGEYVGLVLKDIAKDEVQRGDVLAGSEWDLSEAGQW
jgi:elongation factor Tu